MTPPPLIPAACPPPLPPVPVDEAARAVTRERLRLLSIAYYVSGALGAVFVSFLLIHLCVFTAISFMPESAFQSKGNHPEHPAECPEDAILWPACDHFSNCGRFHWCCHPVRVDPRGPHILCRPLHCQAAEPDVCPRDGWRQLHLDPLRLAAGYCHFPYARRESCEVRIPGVSPSVFADLDRLFFLNGEQPCCPGVEARQSFILG